MSHDGDDARAGALDVVVRRRLGHHAHQRLFEAGLKMVLRSAAEELRWTSSGLDRTTAEIARIDHRLGGRVCKQKAGEVQALSRAGRRCADADGRAPWLDTAPRRASPRWRSS